MQDEKKKIGERDLERLPDGGQTVSPLEARGIGESRESPQSLQAEIQKRVEDIEAGKIPAVDPNILEAARNAITHETAGIDESRANLQRLLEMLNGKADDPSSYLEQVLGASENNPKNSGAS